MPSLPCLLIPIHMHLEVQKSRTYICGTSLVWNMPEVNVKFLDLLESSQSLYVLSPPCNAQIHVSTLPPCTADVKTFNARNE